MPIAILGRCGFAIIAMILWLQIDKPQYEYPTLLAQITRLDPIGTLAFIPSIVCIFLALQWGGATLISSGPRIIVPLIVFCAIFLALCAVQVLWPANATVPIHVIRQKSVTGSTIFAVMQAGSTLLVMYFLPIWFQAVRGYSAMQSGIRTTPMVLNQGSWLSCRAVSLKKYGITSLQWSHLPSSHVSRVAYSP